MVLTILDLQPLRHRSHISSVPHPCVGRDYVLDSTGGTTLSQKTAPLDTPETQQHGMFQVKGMHSQRQSEYKRWGKSKPVSGTLPSLAENGPFASP